MEKVIFQSTKRANRTHKISRTTETVLSVLCLALFTVSMGIVVGAPVYVAHYWSASLMQYEYVLLLSAYLLLLPVALLAARHSLRLLCRVEAMGGRSIPFKRRFKKLKRRQRSYQVTPRIYSSYAATEVQNRNNASRLTTAKVEEGARPLYAQLFLSRKSGHYSH